MELIQVIVVKINMLRTLTDAEKKKQKLIWFLTIVMQLMQLI